MADFELPGYEVYERIGRGGMATVYRALHLNLDREVAIKVMDPSMNKDESFSERFIREARISARLTHPHILQIYDVNTFEGLNYIAMELLAGGELADFIHGAMPQRQIYLILQQMTDALDYASGRGYVHRDIKPSNIMLRSPEAFVLADFGIARAANSGTQMTQTGLMVGTPSYMSPEQAKGQEVDGRSDLYALAVLTYEMLTKTLPYESDSAVTTAVKHLTEDIPTLPEHLAAYQAFIDKGLAKSADDRFQTGRELYEAFMEASAGFDDDQVLTEAVEPPPRPPSGALAGGGERTSLAGVDATRLSNSSATAVSPGSRPYRLESSMQRERLVSGAYENRPGKKTGGGALRMAAVAVILVALGIGAYTWWQGQQGAESRSLGNLTADLASAYNAMNEEDLAGAVRSFNKVLAQDSGNAAARQGMDQLEDLYTASIEKAIADSDAATLNELLLDFSAYFPGNMSLDRYSADLRLLQEEARLADVQSTRIEKLAEQAEESAAAGDFAQARQALEQAAALDAASERIAAAQQVVDEAEAASAAYEARWADFSEAERSSFQAALATADESLSAGELDAAASALQAAASIVEDAPELQSRQQRLQSARDQIAAEVAAEQARVDELLDEADALAGQIRQDPGKAVGAIALYREVQEQYPSNTRAAQGVDAVAGYYLDAARKSAGEGDFDGARQALVAAVEVVGESAGIAELRDSLPDMEQAWLQRQAEAAAQREAQEAARKQVEDIAGRGMRALGSGALAQAQAVYDELEAEHADVEVVRDLQRGLMRGYALAAREQIELREFDAAQDLVSTGAGHFPDEALWVELETEIETARASSRRRLGAY